MKNPLRACQKVSRRRAPGFGPSGLLDPIIGHGAGGIVRKPWAPPVNANRACDHPVKEFALTIGPGGFRSENDLSETVRYGNSAVEKPIRHINIPALIPHLLRLQQTQLTLHHEDLCCRLPDGTKQRFKEVLL